MLRRILPARGSGRDDRGARTTTPNLSIHFPQQMHNLPRNDRISSAFPTLGRRRLGQLAAASAATLLLWGCAVDQEREVAQYREVLTLDVAPVDYRQEEPLTLRQAMLLANENNEALSRQGESYLRALINRRRSVANFLPTVNLVPTYAFREDTGGAGGAAVPGASAEAFDVAATGSINLFNGFRDVAALRRDTYLVEQARNLLLDVQESLLLDVASVYYQVLRSEESARVLANSLVVQEERLRDARGRVAAGVARPLDLALTEAQVSATRVQHINARNDVANGRALLAFLTAAPVERSALADAYGLPAVVPAIAEFQAEALQYRRDLVAAEAAVRAARQDVEVALGQYYPSVSLDLTGYLYRETFPDEQDWTGLLRANLPIFSAGRIRADVREAWSRFREALLARQELRRAIAADVYTAYQDFATADARVAELQVQLRAAEQALRQAEGSYQAGLATNLERIAAQDELLGAQLALVSADFDRKLFYLELLRQAGLLREELESLQPEPLGRPRAGEVPFTGATGPLRLQPPATRPARLQSTAPATTPADAADDGRP